LLNYFSKKEYIVNFKVLLDFCTATFKSFLRGNRLSPLLDTKKRKRG